MSYNSESDTKKMLRECDAGIKMGISVLDDVISSVNDVALEQTLKNAKSEHERLRAETETLLNNIKDEGKSPNPAAKAMSHMKTKMSVAAGEPDSTAARIITKGCDMGVRSLNRYLDKYQSADGRSVKLTRDIIAAEEKMITDLSKYLRS